MDEDTSRLLVVLTAAFAFVLAAIVVLCVVAGVRWHVLTSSYQVFLIGVFCGGLLVTTVVLGSVRLARKSPLGVVVLLLGVLVTGVAQVFFFHLLGGDRYVQRLVQIWGAVWG